MKQKHISKQELSTLTRMLVFCLLCVIAEQFSVLTLHDPVQ